MVVYLKLLFVIEALGNQNLDVHTEVPLRGTGWFNYPQSGIQMVYKKPKNRFLKGSMSV